jgi:hypothetical protein
LVAEYKTPRLLELRFRALLANGTSIISFEQVKRYRHALHSLLEPEGSEGLFG